MRKEHAEHNKQLCEKLHGEGQFHDWIVTTAFYSAIHFVEHCLFPLNHFGRNFIDLSIAHKSLGKTSPHKTRLFLVKNHMNATTHAHYKFLNDSCWSARYIDYRVTSIQSQLAKDALDQVMQECLTRKP